MKKQLFWGEWVNRLKRGLGEFADLRGGLAKKKIIRGEVFEEVAGGGSVETAMNTMSCSNWRRLLIDPNIQSK